MIVCSCHAINDVALETIVDEGARSLREVGDACGAGTDCGKCCRDIAQLLHRKRATIRPMTQDTAPLSK